MQTIRPLSVLALAVSLCGCATAAQPRHVVAQPGPGGADVLVLSNRHGVVEVSLYGAQVRRYEPTGQVPVVFAPTVPLAYEKGGTMFGGIPYAWPWFNMNGEAGSTGHAFARQFKWTVVEKIEEAKMSRLVLELVSNEETRRLWPYDFRLRYTITLADQLQVSLVTLNTGHVPFSVTEGFHSYFRVSDVDQVVLRGLDGVFNDRMNAALPNPVWEGDLKFHAGEGRVFFPGRGEYVLFDEGANRAIAMAARGNAKLILWSIPESSCKGQFSGDDWKHFACLEPATISREAAIRVLPGKEHELRMSIKAAKLR